MNGCLSVRVYIYIYMKSQCMEKVELRLLVPVSRRVLLNVTYFNSLENVDIISLIPRRSYTFDLTRVNARLGIVNESR